MCARMYPVTVCGDATSFNHWIGHLHIILPLKMIVSHPERNIALHILLQNTILIAQTGNK